jgi:hypothetical protein
MINSNILLQIFDAYVIRGISHQWFVSYLKNKQLVEIDWLDCTTDEIQQKQQKGKLSSIGSFRVSY